MKNRFRFSPFLLALFPLALPALGEAAPAVQVQKTLVVDPADELAPQGIEKVTLSGREARRFVAELEQAGLGSAKLVRLRNVVWEGTMDYVRCLTPGDAQGQDCDGRHYTGSYFVPGASRPTKKKLDFWVTPATVARFAALEAALAGIGVRTGHCPHRNSCEADDGLKNYANIDCEQTNPEEPVCTLTYRLPEPRQE